MAVDGCYEREEEGEEEGEWEEGGREVGGGIERGKGRRDWVCRG